MSEQPAWPLPRVGRIADFLPTDEHRALLDWVLASEGRFRPAKVLGTGPKGIVDAETRIALTSRDFGPLRSLLEQRLFGALPQLEQATGCKAGATSLEMELAAHGDGAHYKPHVDISTGEGRRVVGAKPGEDRVLSGVYYLHRHPKHFTGGALRLFRMHVRPSSGPVGREDYIDLEPVDNSLIAFPSWTTHEVLTVRCPSGAFADYRFALNCWFCRRL
jgi:SM-20-related protein